MKLTTMNLTIGYKPKTIIENINIVVNAGEVMAVLGANGSGKTTFFKTMMGFIKPIMGKIEVSGTNIAQMGRKELGRLIAYVPQCHNCTFPYPVKDIVVMGRNPYLRSHQEPQEVDYSMVGQALDKVNITHLEKRSFTKLSGGEKKLVLIARALVQQPKIIMMDEPTSDLDIKNTLNVMNQITSLKEDGMAVLITSHSPKQALFLADKTLLFKDGSVFGYGGPELLKSSDLLGRLYGLENESDYDLINDIA